MPYTLGGMKRFFAYDLLLSTKEEGQSISKTDKNPMKIHGKMKARKGVENQCRIKAMMRFFFVKVKTWRWKSAMSNGRNG